MIEYDKANVTSSYPSLTKKEIATILDKAYLALIGQKVSGNNLRKSGVETDIKAVSDLQDLIVSKRITEHALTGNQAEIPNEAVASLPDDFLYFVQAYILDQNPLAELMMGVGEKNLYTPIQILPHEYAKKFFVTRRNIPWIKTPVGYMEDKEIHILYDIIDSPQPDEEFYIIYVKKPISFDDTRENWDSTQCECNDSMVEELFSLAITFALENVESSRLTSKLNVRGLEA